MAVKLVRKKKHLVNVNKVKVYEKYFYFMSVIPQLTRDKNERGEKQRGISNAKDDELNRSHTRKRRGLMYHTTPILFIMTPHLQINTNRTYHSFPSRVCSASY